MPTSDETQSTERRASVRKPTHVRYLGRFVAGLMLLCATFSLAPQEAHAQYASLVIDADSGKVLHAVNADSRHYPASLTKMMTLYLTFERLHRGIWSFETLLRVSHKAARMPPSKLGVRPGSMITVRDAILALVTKSANDVAVVVSENISGSERNFALRMTATARRLGMRHTTFRNASGLPNRGQMTTARDMATLAQALLRDFPQYYHFFSTTSFTYHGRTYRNHNRMLGHYDGIDGIKTGYIRAAGFNLVASAVRDGRRLIGVVFGGKSSRSRNTHMRKLLNNAFAEINAARIDIARAPRRPSRQGAVKVADAGSSARTPAITATASKAPSNDNGGQPDLDPRFRWGIQVGAFARYNQAMAAARRSAKKLPLLMRHGRIEVVPLKKRSGKTLHRARIYGFSKAQAYLACKKFRDCMEIRLEDPMELASTQR